MSTAGSSAGGAPALKATLKLNDEWRAARVDDGRWYFYDKSKKVQWDPPPPMGEYANSDFDALFLSGNPGACLHPPTHTVRAASEVRVRAREYAAKHAVYGSWVFNSAPQETAPLGIGTWTHAAGANNLATDIAILQANASAVVVTAPTAFGDDVGTMMEWQRLMAALVAPDAALTPEVQQMLVAAPDAFRTEPGPRAAILEVAASSISGTAGALPVLAELCDKYKSTAREQPSGEAGQAAARGLSESLLSASAMQPGGLRGASASTAVPIPKIDAALWNASGAQIANARMIAMFKAQYTPEVGRGILSNASALVEWLGKIFDGLLPDPNWRRALVELADAQPMDRFLALIVNTMAEKGFHHDVAGSTIMAGNYPVMQRVIVDTIAGRCADGEAAPPLSSVVSNEFSAVFAGHVLQRLIARTLVTPSDAAPSADDSGAPTAPGVPAAVLAAKAARTREDLGFAALQNAGANELTASSWAQALSVAPVASAVIAASTAGDDSMSGAPQVDLPGVYDTVVQLRSLSLRLWSSARAEMFPDERFADQAVAASASAERIASVAKSSVADDVSAEEAAAAAVRDLEISRVRTAAMLCAPVSAADVRAAVHCLGALAMYMTDATFYAELMATKAQHEAAMAEDNTVPDEYRAVCLALEGYEFVARVLPQSDVIALLTHLLFHPAVVLDLPTEEREAANGSAANDATTTVANALAWALDVCGRPSSAGDAAYPGVTDSALPRAVLTAAPQLTPEQAPEDAGALDADPSTRVVMTSLAAQAFADTSKSLKPTGTLATFTSLTASGLAYTSMVGGVTPQQALREFLAIMLRASAMPAVAIGVLHWMRHALVVPGIADDPRFPASSAMLLRAAVAIAHQHAFLAPNVLATLHEALLINVPTVDAAALRTYRESIVSMIADVFVAGYSMPTLEYVAKYGKSWDSYLLRKFLTQVCRCVEPPYSLPFGVAVCRVILLTQEKILEEMDAAKASATVSAPSSNYSSTFVVARALDAINKQITDGQRDKAKEILQWVFLTHVESVLAGRAASQPELEPGTEADRTELVRLLREIDKIASEREVL